MIKTLLFWKFGSSFIFQINNVWEANKPAKGEVKETEELNKRHTRMKCRSNGHVIKSLKMKHKVILTFLDRWDLFCRFLMRQSTFLELSFFHCSTLFRYNYYEIYKKFYIQREPKNINP